MLCSLVATVVMCKQLDTLCHQGLFVVLAAGQAGTSALMCTLKFDTPQLCWGHPARLGLLLHSANLLTVSPLPRCFFSHYPHGDHIIITHQVEWFEVYLIAQEERGFEGSFRDFLDIQVGGLLERKGGNTEQKRAGTRSWAARERLDPPQVGC